MEKQSCHLHSCNRTEISEGSSVPYVGRKPETFGSPLPNAGEGLGVRGSFAWLYRSSDTRVERVAAVDLGKFISGDCAVGAKRIDVDVGAAGRQITNFFGPINAESRINGGYHILNTRLFLLVPAGLGTAGTVGVGSSDHESAFHSGARKQCRKDVFVVVSPSHVVQRVRACVQIRSSVPPASHPADSFPALPSTVWPRDPR